jgi:hypothetical protein
MKGTEKRVNGSRDGLQVRFGSVDPLVLSDRSSARTLYSTLTGKLLIDCVTPLIVTVIVTPL